MKKFVFLALAAILLFSLAGISQGNQWDVTLPYTGVIHNNTGHDISVPSMNSAATLIVPARGWIEYQVWEPSFQITGYYNGKAECCQQVTVNPKGYQFMCRAYDFTADICPGTGKEEPGLYKKFKPRIKKRHFHKKKKSSEEGQG